MLKKSSMSLKALTDKLQLIKLNEAPQDVKILRSLFLALFRHFDEGVWILGSQPQQRKKGDRKFLDEMQTIGRGKIRCLRKSGIQMSAILFCVFHAEF